MVWVPVVNALSECLRLRFVLKEEDMFRDTKEARRG